MSAHVVVGIDEAGYGPKLGPLVVSSATVASAYAADGSDLWKHLGGWARRPPKPGAKRGAPRGSQSKVWVGDSKALFKPGSPLQLERSALTLGAWFGQCDIRSVPGLGRALNLNLDKPAYDPWEDEAFELFPLFRGLPLPVRCPGRESQVRPVGLHAAVLRPAEINEKLVTLETKLAVCWELVGQELCRAWKLTTRFPVVAVVDRQSGRRYYSHLLEALFPRCTVEILHERMRSSAYRVVHGARAMKVMFRVEADRKNWCVAAASITAKYIRELLMARFNGFFRSHIPELRPTAGYYGDAARFLKETQQLRKRLGIPDERLVRLR